MILVQRAARGKAWLSLLALFAASGALAENDMGYVECAPQLTGAFAEAVAVSGETRNYQTLRLQFGPKLAGLLGLPCTPERLLQILTDAGWERGYITTLVQSPGKFDTIVVAHYPDNSIWGYLRGLDSGKASIALLDNTTSAFSIGAVK